jgi:hypothetical protein
MYNKQSVFNEQIQAGASDLHTEGMLTDEQLKNTKQAFPSDFYQSNPFVKIGLFIFTTFVIFFIEGILALLFGELLFKGDERVIGFAQLILSLILFLFIENLDNFSNQKLYRAGTDNALIYTACFSLNISLVLLFHFTDFSIANVSLTSLIIGIAAWRYGDVFLSVFLAGSLNALLFLILAKFPFGKAILPFATMLYWAIIGLASRQLKQNNGYFYWHDAADLLETVALVGFYAGGNYWVVRECSANLENQYPSVQIPFAFLFWFFTITIPILYLYAAHHLRERKFLIISLLCMLFSIATYRCYYSVMPSEVALTLSGALLIGLSIFLIRQLKTPKWGFSDEAIANKNNLLATLVVSQILKTQQTPENTGVTFGGGDTGGGGASSEF